MTHAAHEQRVCLVPGVDGFRTSPSSYYSTGALGGAASGPAGSSSMLFFCLMYQRRAATVTAQLFGRTNSSNGGWMVLIGNTGQVFVRVYNSAPALVSLGGATTTAVAMEGLEVPYLVVGSYTGGFLSGWINGVSMGAPAAAGVGGFTSFAGPTSFARRSSTDADRWALGPLSDSGLLDGYDVGTYVDPIFGNGGPGLSARWLADLREGRYLTWPRAAVANADWYWAARDAALGVLPTPTWTDRYTGTVMTRFGQPQSASFPARPL